MACSQCSIVSLSGADDMMSSVIVSWLCEGRSMEEEPSTSTGSTLVADEANARQEAASEGLVLVRCCQASKFFLLFCP